MNNQLSSKDENNTKKATLHEVNFHSNVTLSGTLNIPNNNKELKPSVVFIPGSGSVDRDGNVKQFKSDLLLKLSELFTRNGFITLRYDKRGIGKSTGCYLESGLTEFISDAVSAVRFLKSVKEVDPQKIIILGHSEGAFIAPAVYSQEPTNGLILLCGTATPTKDLLPLQMLKLIEEIKHSKGIKGALLKLFRIQTLVKWQWDMLNKKLFSSNKPVIKILGMKKFNAKWFRESCNYNVREYLPNIICSTLIIGGEKDIQCVPDEVNDIAKLIAGSCTADIIPNMNHILCYYENQHHLLSLMHEYKQSLKNGLSTAFIETLTHWLKQWSSLNITRKSS